VGRRDSSRDAIRPDAKARAVLRQVSDYYVLVCIFASDMSDNDTVNEVK